MGDAEQTAQSEGELSTSGNPYHSTPLWEPISQHAMTLIMYRTHTVRRYPETVCVFVCVCMLYIINHFYRFVYFMNYNLMKRAWG